MAVTTPMKDLLERIDPGMHQFHPVRITMPRVVEYPEPYHVLVIGRFLDAFVPEKSDEEAWERSELIGCYSSVSPAKKTSTGSPYRRRRICGATGS